jgi:hypothetical protein
MNTEFLAILRLISEKTVSLKYSVPSVIDSIIKNLSNKVISNCVLVLSKAVHCVEHKTLLDKLYQYLTLKIGCGK